MTFTRQRKPIALLTMLVFMFTIAFGGIMPATAAEDGSIERIAGETRFDTAANIANSKYPGGADSVVIANSKVFADAINASLLASHLNAPILLNELEHDNINGPTNVAITTLGAQKAYIVGGTAAVSEAAEDFLKNKLGEDNVVRVDGETRNETAAKIASYADVAASFGFIAAWNDDMNALAAGAVAARDKAPILLAQSGAGLPGITTKTIKELGLSTLYVLGDESKITADQVAALEAIDGVNSVQRISDSVAIANTFFADAAGVTIANGNSLVDALGGSVFAQPIVYVDSDSIPAAVEAYLAGKKAVKILGGTAAVNENVENAIKDILADGEVVGDLTVIDVNAINSSTIEVTFSKAVDSIATDNFSLSKGEVQTATLNSAKTVATLGVKGLGYGDETTITVLNVTAGEATLESYSQEVKVPGFGEFYGVQITAGDDVILADGLSKTMVQARIIEKGTGNVVKKEGLVSFTTTKGDFAQPEVSFDQDGTASLQLTSEVSLNTITAFITATVVSVPGATDYEGLVGQTQVRFAPPAEYDEQLKMVALESASASQADRINLTFSGSISLNEILSGYANMAAARADNFGFRVDGFGANDSVVLAIEQLDAKTIRLILDVDDKFPIPDNTTELRWDHLTDTGTAVNPVTGVTVPAGSLNGAFLRDNMTHNVSVPVNIGKKVVANSDGVNFVLTDISKPWIASVDVKDQMILKVKFSEAMAADLVEITESVMGANLYKNLRIDGKRLMQSSGLAPTFAATSADKALASDNNYLIVRSLRVDNYYDAAGNVVDERHIVTIEIDPWNKLSNGSYSIQASNVGDWAAMTHEANLLETQTFDFEVEADTSVPTAKLEVQSPEQWLITFDKPVKLTENKALRDAIKIYTKTEYAKEKPAAFTMTNAVAPVKHYQVTGVNEDGELVLGGPNGIAPTADDSVVNSVSRLLIEFKQDWTVEYNTSSTNVNYFHSTKSPYIVVLDHWVHNITENEMAKIALQANVVLDANSPEIVNATDVFDIAGQSIRGVTALAAGQFVFVEMNEPVQLRNAPDTIVTTPLTESQQQALGAGIPIPTFEFVKGDTVIPGSIVAGSIPQDDYDFVVEPDTALTAGTWTLIIRSISDDVGNTSATVTREFVVAEGEVTVADTRIAWIGFDNDGEQGTVPEEKHHDYIYIKFTKEMKSTGANGVARTTNYTLNNNPLPTGSEVLKGIRDFTGNSGGLGNVTNDWDGVTIKMPKNAWQGTSLPGDDRQFTMVVGVASNFEATDSERLAGPYTVQLDDQGNNDLTAHVDGDFDFEAYYRNSSLSVINNVNLPVLMAEAQDTNLDGKYDTIILTMYEAISSSNTYKVNGVNYGAVQAGNIVTLTNNTDNAISTGTALEKVRITTDNGAILAGLGALEGATIISSDRDFAGAVSNKNIYINNNAVIKNLTMAPGKVIYCNPGSDGEITLDNVTADTVVILSGSAKPVSFIESTIGNLHIATKQETTIELKDNTVVTLLDGKSYVDPANVKLEISATSAVINNMLGKQSVAVNGVTLDKATATVNVGDTVTLTATIDPANATNQSVTWTSSDDTIATVANGVVTAVAKGTATITVETLDGNKTATCTVEVTEGAATGDATIGEIGQTTQIVPGVYNVEVPFNNAQSKLGADETNTLILTIGADQFEMNYNAKILSGAGGFLAAAVQGYTEDEIKAGVVTVKTPPAVVTATDLSAKVTQIVPGVYNVEIPFAEAQAQLGADETSTILLQIGADTFEATYNAKILGGNGGFLAAAVQGYAEADIDVAVATLK